MNMIILVIPHRPLGAVSRLRRAKSKRPRLQYYKGITAS